MPCKDGYVVLRHKDYQAIEAQYAPVAWAGFPGTYHTQPESEYARVGPYQNWDLIATADGPEAAIGVVSDDIRRRYSEAEEGETNEN